MAAVAGFLHQHFTSAQALAGTNTVPMASPAAAASGSGATNASNGSGSAGGDSATISANDFLTLLVTEMQNQDPTANTDPNQYINQLVQVNSLEQLIDINQTLTADSTPVTTATNGTAAAAATTAKTANSSIASPAVPTAAVSNKASALRGAPAAAAGQAEQAAIAPQAPGNLSVPRARPAPERVAHALDGRWHAHR